ncbi:MAG: PEP-CTERM sorting domain-containing protein [Gemmatimonadaceae bacterium]
MKYAFRVALICIPLSASVARAQVPVNLNTWSTQSYPAVPGFGAGVWTVAPDGSSVHQTVNGQPTMFASDFNAQGTEVKGRIRSGGGDDDFIGFALGYHTNDITNANANYLLLDWKAGTQNFDFGAPNDGPGGNALRGLAVSRVNGIPTANEFWQHNNFAGNTNGSLTELQRGLTLGSTGWVANTTYDFTFIFLPNLLQVFVNDVLQINLAGNFNDGSMAFYNFSQADVTYSAFTKREITTTAPEPASFAMMAFGLFAVGYTVTRRKRV